MKSKFGTCAMCRGSVYFVEIVMYCASCDIEMFECVCSSGLG